MSFLNEGTGCHGAQPMSLERLQQVYSADERRAIHDAVVSAVPSCHDLTDLALLSGDDQSTKRILSRTEILVELRNMRRRRTKYRVAAKTRNYSDVLRDVIKTQMEHYTEEKNDRSQNEIVNETNNQKDHFSESSNSRPVSKDYDKRRRDFPRHSMVNAEVKIERGDSTESDRGHSRERTERRRDKYDRHPDRSRFDDRSRERGVDEDLQRSYRSHDESRKRRHRKDSDKHKESHQISNDMRKGYGSDTEHDHEKRSRKSHKHRQFHEVKQEPGHEKYHHRHKDRRYDEKTDKTKQEDRAERNYDDYRYTDRGRSSVAQDKRHDGKHGERVYEYIKQERGVNISKDYMSRHYKIESRDRRLNEARYETSYRDASTESYSSQSSPKQEKYNRHHDRPSEEFKIKTEK